MTAAPLNKKSLGASDGVETLKGSTRSKDHCAHLAPAAIAAQIVARRFRLPTPLAHAVVLLAHFGGRHA